MREKRLKLERDLLMSKMNEINPKEAIFKESVSDLYKIVFGYACPYINIQEATVSLLPRQYACARNAFLRITDEDYLQAWWEIYDFIEAGNEEHLTLFEITILSICLELLSLRI